MQKIEIEFKNQTLKIYLVVKEKNLDKTLLNTNIISNEKLLFSLDYIAKNQKLVSSFLKEICVEKKTNLIIANDMTVISTVAPCFKNIPINGISNRATEYFAISTDFKVDTINLSTYCEVVAKIVPPLNDIDETKQFLILFKEQKFNRCTFMHSIFMEKIKTNITCNMRMQITLNEFKILK